MIKSKLKYHQIVEAEITSKVTRKGKEIHTITCKLIENSELISELENQAGRFILNLAQHENCSFKTGIDNEPQTLI